MEVMEAPPEKRKLTLKQAKWLKRLNETGSPTKAAQEVYDCQDVKTANTIGRENCEKLGINLRQLMDRMGLSDEKLVSKIAEGVDATKVISAIVKNPAGDFVDANGKSNDFIEVPDYNAQHKFTETALKLKGHLRNDDQQNFAPVMIQINVGGEEQKPIESIEIKADGK